MIPEINLFVVFVDSFPGVPQDFSYLPYSDSWPTKKGDRSLLS
jgi:hypothetical protein